MAGFATWHPQHEAAHAALTRDVAIVAHAAFETYSVLTRLPEPHTMAADVVREWLHDTFGSRWLGLPARGQRAALVRLERHGVAGGATYDGLIALTAAGKGARLLTLDRRALQTYARLGVDVELIG